MKKLILSAVTAVLVVSCEKKIPENETTDSSPDSIVVVPETNEPVESSTLQSCYMAAVGKDSVFVSLEDNLGTIIGKMHYKNFEKDSSIGDVVGSQNGDTLKLVYTFRAERTVSDREIYFLKKEGNIIEATGEYKTEGKSVAYSHPEKIKYDGTILKQIDCTDFDKNFKVK